eukprot:6209245-Pleurochrysis_carterae.AAC.1
MVATCCQTDSYCGRAGAACTCSGQMVWCRRRSARKPKAFCERRVQLALLATFGGATPTCVFGLDPILLDAATMARATGMGARYTAKPT